MNQNEIENDLQQLAEDWSIDDRFSATVVSRIQASRKAPNVDDVSGFSTPIPSVRKFRSVLAASLAVVAALAVVLGILNGRHGDSFVSAEMLSAAVREAIESIETAKMTVTSFDDSGKELGKGEYLFDREQGFVRGAWIDGAWTIVDLDNGKFQWVCDHEKDVVIRRPSRKQFVSYFNQAALSDADYERREEEDILRDGQAYACYEMKNLAPFSDGPQRVWVFVDSDNLLQQQRTWKFKNDRWNLVEEIRCAYNVEVNAACFEPKFDSKFEIVDIEKEIDSLASIDNCLFSQNLTGLTYAIHRATPIEGGGLAVFASLRETSPDSAAQLEMWNFALGSGKVGDFYRITNGEAMDRVRMQWFLLVPRRSSWKSYVADGGIARIAAANSIVHGKRVKFSDTLWLPGIVGGARPKSNQVNVKFEFEDLPRSISLKEAASLVFEEQQQLPHVSYKELHTGVKLISGTPTEQRETTASISKSEYQKAVVDHLAYQKSRDHESDENMMENQITKGFTTIRVPAMHVHGIDVFGDEQLARACQRKDLVQVDVSATSVTDIGIESLLKLKNLEQLALKETAITDKSVEVLVQLKSLVKLDIRETEISTDGVRRLKESMNGVAIKH